MSARTTDARREAVWRENRGRLFGLAYRMLGSVSEAEDAVQDTFARYLKVSEREEIADPTGWLLVACSRICLDGLKSARARRESYVGPWLPEPLLASADEDDPAERVTLDESVSIAMLVVMERLSPPERVAFILHDIFGLAHAKIAEIVGRSPEATRKLASRARRRVRGDVPARSGADRARHREVVSRFIAAAREGDLAGLAAALDPEVEFVADSGGAVQAPRRALVGRERVAKLIAGGLARTPGLEPVAADVNLRPGMAITDDDGALVAVVALEVADGAVKQIHAVANPSKLAHLSGPSPPVSNPSNK